VTTPPSEAIYIFTDYVAGFWINEMNLFTGAADYCLEVPIGAFGRIIINFVPDLQRPFS
jgi:hypothetical protein